jgi:hypothetical protein
MGMPLVPVNAEIKCPHTGMVIIATANARVSSATLFLATATDQFQVAGCKNPPTAGPMCSTVQWLMPATRVTICGQFALLATSIGLCLPLSVPAVLTPALCRVKGI